MSPTRLCVLALALTCCTASFPDGNMVTSGKNGKLKYAQTPKGDRIMDYSHAGYMGGGVALPEVPGLDTVVMIAGVEDYTPLIQSAIDRVSALPVKDGFRGAVILGPGTFPCSGAINISADGVVLRGSGTPSDKRSTIVMSGDRHAALNIQRPRPAHPRTHSDAPAVKVTDKYVPFGSSSVHLADASSFKPGDEVWIRKPVTSQWIAFMHMDDLWRNGKPETWLAVGSYLTTARTISKVSGRQVWFTVPLADSYDRQYTSDSTFVSLAPKDDFLVKQSGVENLIVVSPDQPVNHTVSKYYGLRIYGKDCWARDVDFYETMESVHVGGSRITLRKVSVIRNVDHVGSSKPAEFAPDGSQVLMDSCYVRGNNLWSVGIGARIPGPIVMLNCTFDGNCRMQGHQRWSTAFLLDNCKSPDGGIDFLNRGEMGSGHGWTTGWSVAWNCEAKEFINQNPPGSYNWMIGCIGKRVQQRRPFDKEGPFLPEGEYISHGTHVSPESLYLSQLEERLGKAAVKAIGY